MLAGVALAVLASVAFAAHPVLHAGPNPAHAAGSSSSVPDPCTLCQTHNDAASAEPAPSLLEDPVQIEPAPQFYVSPLRLEEPILGSLSPRAPPR